MIRTHKETYEDLARYANETGFYNALQDYLEECGFTVAIQGVRKNQKTFEVNGSGDVHFDFGWLVLQSKETMIMVAKPQSKSMDYEELILKDGYWSSPEILAKL